MNPTPDENQPPRKPLSRRARRAAASEPDPSQEAVWNLPASAVDPASSEPNDRAIPISGASSPDVDGAAHRTRLQFSAEGAGAMPLPRNTDASLLPEEHREDWTLPAARWDDYSGDQRRRWRAWFDWAVAPGGELWDPVAGEGHGAAALANVNLDKADLRHARLNGADLRHCHLHSANLMHADLRGANLLYARLAGASLVLADARYAEFQGAGLSLAQCGSIKADGAVFRGAQLSRADFQRASLSTADFSDAVLDEARLSLAELRETNFRSAKLRHAQLDGVNLEYAKLTSADLTGARLFNAKMAHADLSLATLDDAELDGACLDEATIHRVDLSRTDFSDATLFACRISEPTWWFGLPRATPKGVVFPPRLPQHPIQDVLGLPQLLRRRIADVQYLRDLHERSGRLGRAAMWLWGLTCNFGQSLTRWAAWSALAILAFASVVTFLPFNIATAGVSNGQAVSAVANPTFFQSVYFSVVTFTTLGYGDLSPADDAARLCVGFGVFGGYMMLGGLISILANKLARLS